MTRRNLQTEVLKKQPREPGKSFDQCAACTAIYPAAKVGGKAGIDAFTELRWITVETLPGAYPI